MRDLLFRQSFAYNLVEIITAIVTSENLKFSSFINNTDILVWIALEQGDVVPQLYISEIDKALTELSTDFNGKYIEAYALAVQTYNENYEIDKMADSSIYVS